MQNIEMNFAMSACKKEKSWIIDILVIFALSCLLYLGTSFARPLASPDEGRYSEIPREMAVDGDWTTPRLNGMPYFYKPPMFYWMQAASIKTFGINRVSLRLVNSLMAVFGILATYAAARILYDRKTGIFSAAILATSLLYYALGQVITLDMTVAAFMSASLFAFIVALKKSGVWRATAILSTFALAAAATLSKGLIGIVIPCAVVFFYMFFVGWKNFWSSFSKIDILTIFAGTTLFFAIAAPWHVVAALANPPYETAEGLLSKNWEGQGFFWYYFIHEHILRYIDVDTSMRPAPFWFFFALAPAGVAPWIVFAPRAVADWLKDSRGQLRTKNTAIAFCLIWTLFVIAFFSISKSKLPAYIIPIYPATALVLGRFAVRWWNGDVSAKPESWILAILGYIAAIALVTAYFIQMHKGKIIDPQLTIFAMSVCAAILTIGSTICITFLKKRKTRKFIIGAFITIFCFFMCFNPVGQAFQRPSTEGIVKRSMNALSPDDAVVIYTDYGVCQDLPVWTNRLPVCVGGAPEEQRFGLMRERAKNAPRFLDGDEGFASFKKTVKGDIYIFAYRQQTPKILRQNPQAKEIDSEGFLTLIKINSKK